jgi:hypothetical protein
MEVEYREYLLVLENRKTLDDLRVKHYLIDDYRKKCGDP